MALFFVCCASVWLIQTSLYPKQPKPEEVPHFYSNQCQQDLRLLFIDALEQAKNSIHLIIFGLSDPAIIDCVQKKIHENISTTIYYDPSGSAKLYHKLKGSKLIPVQHGALMHQKLLILDRERVFIGSANMTSASLAMHDNLVIGLHSPTIAKFLEERAPYSSGYLQTMVGGQKIELWLLPDPRGHVLIDLKRHLKKASHSIKAALFTFTHPALIDELISAHERGVSVIVVIDLHSGLGASAKAVARLKKAGITVCFSQGIQLLHHKFVFIDEQLLLTGSANWTKAAFSKNSDCIIALHQLTSVQKTTMRNLWRTIQTQAKVP